MVGYEFLGTDDQNRMMVKIRGVVKAFELLHVLEFSSKRKRMSVILRNENNEIILYSKGADSILLDRIDKSKYFLFILHIYSLNLTFKFYVFLSFFCFCFAKILPIIMYQNKQIIECIFFLAKC